MVMHARKHIRLDGYFDRNQTHSYENSGSKYSKSPFGDNGNDKSLAAESGASLVAAMDSPENSRRPSPRYLHKASYAQRLKERDHHHEVKSPMSKERSNRSREHSHHHHSSSSQHHGQQSNSTPGSSSSSRNKNSTSETSTSNYARSNHDRSHVEVKMEPEKERKGQVGDWSEHVSSSGKKYYYNCRTEVSQWEKPREWIEWEKVHGINKTVEVSNKLKDKSSGVTPSKGAERHSNSRSSANSSSRTSHHHQHSGSSHPPQRESHSHSHRHDRSHQSSSNRSHSVNDQRNADQASSASSSSSSSSNSSNSSASANKASAGTARNSGRRDERPRGDTTLADEAPEKSETKLNDHGSRQESGSNHLTNYHHHNSASSSNKRSNSRKDSAQDMDISPDSSFSADNNNFISADVSRSHQYQQQQQHCQQQQMAGGSSLTPSRLSKSSNSGGNYFASTPSAMNTPIQSLGSALTPGNSASTVTPQLLSPSQVTLANLPRLISQLTGTRGLPNLSEMSQQEGSEGGRIDSSNIRGGTPSSDFHSHSSRQTSPASSAGSPSSVSVPVNNSNVTTSVAAAMAAAAAAANSSGSLSSAVSLKPSTPSLTPSLANYYREDLVTHVTGWQADHAERQASRYGDDAHNIGSLNSTRVSAELKMARSLVRLAEIQATLQEQRILFLRQQVKELEDRRSQNSFMMDS